MKLTSEQVMEMASELDHATLDAMWTEVKALRKVVAGLRTMLENWERIRYEEVCRPDGRSELRPAGYKRTLNALDDLDAITAPKAT